MSLIPQPNYSALDNPDVCEVLFHPRKTYGPIDGNGHFLELMIPVEVDIRVGSRFYLTDLEKPVILFFHGNGEIAPDYNDIAPLFNRSGLNFIVVDYRGYGCSNGIPTVSAMMADCHKILEFIEKWKSREGYTGPMIVMGRSLGSASALELANVYGDRIDGLVIESGFAWAAPLLRLLGVESSQIEFSDADWFTNVEKIRGFTKPTVIIHAEFDHIIPYSDGKTLFDASGAKEKALVKIPGANHNNIFMHGLDLYMDSIKRLSDILIVSDPGI